MTHLNGSYLRPGDRLPFWTYYDDCHEPVQLAASLSCSTIIRNDRLSLFVSDPGALAKMAPCAFYPPALGARANRTALVDALLSGGRTFLLARSAHKSIGWPTGLRLDLKRLGWGNGTLEVRPEVKGAGTLFERTGLSHERVRTLLARTPARLAHYDAAMGANGEPPRLMRAAASFMKRPLGGQSLRFARQAVQASAVQLGRSSIKFVPVVMAVAEPEPVARDVKFLRRALQTDRTLFNGGSACEIRLTPGTVRAVYFDRLEDERELAVLAKRVSIDGDERRAALDEMIIDARRHLELMIGTTQPAENGAFDWIKVSDVNEKFSPEAAADLRQQRYAWFLAKDEIVVRRVGKFFTDMESFFGKDVGYRSPDWATLLKHHTLVAMVVLRDHMRVCAQFALGCRAAERGEVDIETRKEIARDVGRRIVASVNVSPMLDLQIEPEGVRLHCQYPAAVAREATLEIAYDDLAMRA